jgi:hypothetical protein
MTARDPETTRLAEIVAQAAELAALAPESLREAAFHRVFDELSGSVGAKQHVGAPGPAPRRSTSRHLGAPRSAIATESAKDPATLLINSLSRTDHPEIATATRSLDRALHLLQIAEAEHEIDGMTASQIARVLTEKFRQRVSRQAINQALDSAGNYVDRTPGARGVVYRLMQPGEVYLASGCAEEPVSNAPHRSRRRGAAAKPGAGRVEKTMTGTSGASTARKRSGRGPKAMIEELIGEGFFSEPRTIGVIQERLRSKKGAAFKPGDLSPTLVRLLRQNKLDRERNASNQYEYTLPS